MDPKTFQKAMDQVIFLRRREDGVVEMSATPATDILQPSYTRKDEDCIDCKEQTFQVTGETTVPENTSPWWIVCGGNIIPDDNTSFKTLKEASTWFHEKGVLKDWGCKTRGTRPQIKQAATAEEAKK